jgi:putative glutamine amidotransferase
MKHQVAISVEDTQTPHRASHYSDWIKKIPRFEPVFVCYRYKKDFNKLKECQALVLSGGSDVDPAFYDLPPHPKVQEVISARDEFEMELIQTALDQKIPVLGICRGLQIFNVYCGGTLIPDIEDAGYPSHRAVDRLNDRFHLIRVSSGTNLSAQLGVNDIGTNSAHHQAVDKIGEKLKVGARSIDNIIEALEWENPADGSFLMLVQWHPERLPFEHRASKNILITFAYAVRKVSLS